MTLNFVQKDTLTGIKEFELLQGDITKLPFKVDLLCISAFKDDYTPTKSSIVGQLYAKGINVGNLAQKPHLDLKEGLGIWISSPISNANFKQIICTEITGHKRSFEETIKNLFAALSILEIQNEQNKTIAIPLLGSGDQGIELKRVISTLLDASLDFLKYSRYLRKIYFVVYDEAKASALNDEMNSVLNRKTGITPKSDLAEILRKDLIKNIDLLINIHNDLIVYEDLKRIVSSAFRPFEFGAISRKALESLINELNPKASEMFDLMSKIESLKSQGVSQWIMSYMHTIRIFGNEAVHDKVQSNRNPKSVDEKDLEIGMYCMIRIIDFYLSFRKA